MIRRPITSRSIRARIRAIKPTWFDRAATALAALPAAPTSEDFARIWSEIKPVYSALQDSKCIFCEKPLEGLIEEDVEHFRPKTEVKSWTPPADIEAALAAEGIAIVQPADGSNERGYSFLAYHPFNYAVACKPCNTVLKANYFPIAGQRRRTAHRPPSREIERPFLIYPIGDLDDDPEDLITWLGCHPLPTNANGFDGLRAMVTIAIFKLDDPNERPMFYGGRARAVSDLFTSMRAMEHDPDQSVRHAAQTKVEGMLRDSEPYASCLRTFYRLYHDDPDAARDEFVDITTFLDTKS